MRVVLATVGSTGDLEPFYALAKTLLAHGHLPVVYTQQLHQPRLQSADIAHHCYPYLSDIHVINQVITDIGSQSNQFQQMLCLLDSFYLNDVASRYQFLIDNLEQADVALCNMYDHVAIAACESKGIPWLTVDFCPMVHKTAYAPPALLPSLGKRLNPVAWSLFQLFCTIFNRRMATAFDNAGVPHQRWPFMNTISARAHIVATSPRVAAIYPDFPKRTITTGHWFDTSRPPSPEYDVGCSELVAFLQRYPKPVLVTFGSMGGNRGEYFSQELLRCAQITGEAMIIQSGYAGLASPLANCGPPILSLGFVDHQYLMPRAGMVIHHCGAGTSIGVCRAGVPSIAVPHISDQPYWAQRLYRIGVSPKPLAIQHFTGKRLAKRVMEVRNYIGYSDRAQALARQMQNSKEEQGCHNMVKWLEHNYPEFNVAS